MKECQPESSWVGLGRPAIVEFYSMYEYNLFTTNIDKARLDSVILDNEQYRKEVQVLLELVERRIHRAIELDQLILLEAEVLQDDLQKIGNTKANETLQSIESRTEEHAAILHEIRRKLREALLDKQKKNDENTNTS